MFCWVCSATNPSTFSMEVNATSTGLKYEDVDLQKKKAIRDGKKVGVLPTKEEMKLRISVNDKGVPIFPNKQMEKEFIKDIKNKFKYPKASLNMPEELKASGLAKKYPISERQVERATRYYKDKLIGIKTLDTVKKVFPSAFLLLKKDL